MGWPLAQLASTGPAVSSRKFKSSPATSYRTEMKWVSLQTRAPERFCKISRLPTFLCRAGIRSDPNQLEHAVFIRKRILSS